MQKYHDEPKQYKGYLKSALVRGGLHATFRERRHSQANFTAKRNATAINVGEHSPRRPAIPLIKT